MLEILNKFKISSDAMVSLGKNLKSQVEIHESASSEDSRKRDLAAHFLGIEFLNLVDKVQAWEDLHRLTLDENLLVRWRATEALGSAFPFVPDKDLAWQDLQRLTRDERGIRMMAVEALGLAFPHILDKELAWQDLHTLTLDEDIGVRWSAVEALGLAFSFIPDKDLAWQDLHRLTSDKLATIKSSASIALGNSFLYIPDQDLAWQDIHRLAQDEDRIVRSDAALALAFVFRYIPYKDMAWQDLLRLTKDDDLNVRQIAVEAIGYAIPYILNKEIAFARLHELVNNEEGIIRSYAYYALGRASILAATEAIDNTQFKNRLEDAIEYFYKSSSEIEYLNSAAFCLPFYRSLYGIFFMDRSSAIEIEGYLIEARKAIEESESKEFLLEAIENLSKALSEARSYTIDDLASRRQELRSYTRYCFRAADCLARVRDRAPLASKVIDAAMVERGFPIIDEKIKALFNEVEIAAKDFCKGSKGTHFEDIGKSAYDRTKNLSKINSPIAADCYLLEIVPLLKAHCDRLPEDAQGYLKTLVESQDIATLEQRFETLKLVLLTSLSQAEKTITNIYGDVHGPILSGVFSEEVNIGEVKEKHNP